MTDPITFCFSCHLFFRLRIADGHLLGLISSRQNGYNPLTGVIVGGSTITLNGLKSIVVSWVFTGFVQQGLCGGFRSRFCEFLSQSRRINP
jgi:hypothetical protein